MPKRILRKAGGLRARFFVMAKITLLMVFFLFVSSYVGFMQNRKHIEAMHFLNSMNQHLLQGIISEKVFLGDFREENLQSALKNVRQSIEESVALEKTADKNLIPMIDNRFLPFEAELLRRQSVQRITELLRRYEDSIIKLSETVKALNQKRGETDAAVETFEAAMYGLIEAINRYELQSRMERKAPNERLIQLREVARDAIIATVRFMNLMENRLFGREDTEGFAAERDEALNRLKEQMHRASMIRDYIEFETDDPVYFNAIELIGRNYNSLVDASAALVEIIKKKVAFQGASDVLREQALDMKEEMIRATTARAERLSNRIIDLNLVAFLVILVILIAGLIYVLSAVVNPITRIVPALRSQAERGGRASQQLTASSHHLTEASSEQAASLEETAASLEQISNMTRQNADNAEMARSLMESTEVMLKQSNESMGRLNDAIARIAASSQATQAIIKAIDEIAFQTNLLALNASVEAARAGNAGTGFSVVAQEVRGLAIRSKSSAESTAEKLNDSVLQISAVSEILARANADFSSMCGSVEETGHLVRKITEASRYQAEGIEQINQAVSQIDQSTQQNAAQSEEVAALSMQMKAQSNAIRKIVDDLVKILGNAENHAAKGEGSHNAEVGSHGLEHPSRRLPADGKHGVLLP